jgi:hypothetical protein
MPARPHPGIRISVVRGDVLRFRADVLALEYAQAVYGADRAVVDRLRAAGLTLPPLPKPGDSLRVESRGAVAADSVLFVGVGTLVKFGYREIRDFGRMCLEIVEREAGSTRTVGMTAHGAGYGLDEAEAFRSQVAGLLDAVQSGRFPPTLESITVVEHDPERAKILEKVLRELVPDGIVETDAASQRAKIPEPARESLRSAGAGSDAKPSVFVAMPFAREFDAVYRHGLEKPVRDAGYLCERADLASFTGDVIQWVKERITRAELVIADLSGTNANVYLEVGFAWGCGKPTMLVVSRPEDLGFNVRGQRCLVYGGDITVLEELVRKELAGLAKR